MCPMRAEGGAYDELLALHHRGIHLHERRLDALKLDGEVARDLVREQHRDLFEELSELACRRVFASHQGQFVLNERMADDVDILEADNRHTFDAFEDLQRLYEAGFNPARKIDLAWVTGDDHPAVFT